MLVTFRLSGVLPLAWQRAALSTASCYGRRRKEKGIH
jgi:hypothetical protein